MRITFLLVGCAMQFVVEMRSILADGRETSFKGVVDAPNILNAVGQACLRFGVRTDALVYLKVEVESGPKG